MDTVNDSYGDHDTAYDAAQRTAVAENKRRPCKTAKEAQRNHPLILGAWNVRTTDDNVDSARPERATAIICRELEKAQIDIFALSEVRRPGSGNVIERSHTIFWSGGEKKEAGVGFAINYKLVAQGMNPNPINDRLMTLRIQLRSGVHRTLISAYAPTMQRTQEEKEQFYEKLGDCQDMAKNDNTIILGDFNASVGKDWKLWPSVIGKHGVGKMNSNGIMLLEFCTRFQLSIMGTMFQLKNRLKSTWQHLRSKHWHQLDHVIVNKEAKQHITVTKVNLTATALQITSCLFANADFLSNQRKKVLNRLRSLILT